MIPSLGQNGLSRSLQTIFNRSLLPWMDVIAIFCLAVLPHIARSLFMVLFPAAQATPSLNQLLAILIVGSLQISVPILLIMHLRKVRWADHGFVSFSPDKDILIAFGLTAASYIAYYVAVAGLFFFEQNYTSDANPFRTMSTEGASPYVTLILIFSASIANGFTEELAMRAYLIPRLSKLTGSDAVAVILTSALFAIYHMYQGRYGIISALLIGLIFGSYFVRTKRFWPIALAHIFMDIIPLAMLAFPPE